MKLKAKTPVQWKDRNGNYRTGETVTLVKEDTPVESKLNKKLLALPARRRKIEPTARFDRWIVREVRDGMDYLFSRRPEELTPV